MKHLSSLYEFFLVEGSAEREGDTGDKTFCTLSKDKRGDHPLWGLNIPCPCVCAGLLIGRGWARSRQHASRKDRNCQRSWGTLLVYLVLSLPAESSGPVLLMGPWGAAESTAWSSRHLQELPCASMDLQVPLQIISQGNNEEPPSLKESEIQFSFSSSKQVLGRLTALGKKGANWEDGECGQLCKGGSRSLVHTKGTNQHNKATPTSLQPWAININTYC